MEVGDESGRTKTGSSGKDCMKAHLHNSEDPAMEGTTLKAVCGVDVERALFVHLWDSEFFPGDDWRVSLKFGSCCRKCLAGELPLRRIYGVVSGG